MLRLTALRARTVVLGSVAAVAATVGLSSSGALAAGKAQGPNSSKVIVILRNQNHGLAARSAARHAAVTSEQAPIIAALHQAGAGGVASTSLLNAVTATVSPQTAAALSDNPAVADVIPDATIPGPAPIGDTPAAGTPSDVTAPPCGTAASPEQDPEALADIDAPTGSTDDGAGVTVAFLADGFNPTLADYQRNAQFASAGSATGSPVVTDSEDFSGDGTAANQNGDESYIDASAVGAQANTVFDLSAINPALPTGCDITVQGDAPGADMMSLKVFASNNFTTTSGFIQAVDYAVSHGVKVVNESFGATQFPSTTLDAIREADDAAVAAGVTVVVSSGDAGPTNTIESPASDPNVISVGASTTFRFYAQRGFHGINAPGSNGRWINDNLSALSSSGFDQDGGTIDLVAPGDLNWDVQDNGLGEGGGTSESAPLTAGAAADVIEAYEESHAGADPTPAQIKQILTSSAKDIDAPAEEQGAGLLDVQAAIKLARSLPGTTDSSPSGGVLTPGQINVTQEPGQTTSGAVSLTNTGTTPVTVDLSTRAFTKMVNHHTGSFCMQPGPATASCPANSGTFPSAGTTENYQAETFNVLKTKRVSRLVLNAVYPGRGQEMGVALLEPDGTFAGYSLPQGVGDHSSVEVADPVAGTWTAIFFTPANFGVQGTVQWSASEHAAAAAGAITPSMLTIDPGQTSTAALQLTSPKGAGDAAQSVVVSSPAGQTTVPVTVRTVVAIANGTGKFSGVLTGGNGRGGSGAQENAYAFDVPAGTPGVDVGVKLATDPNNALVAELIDPSGQTIAIDTNANPPTLNGPVVATKSLDLHAQDPVAGRWRVLLNWISPVSAGELTDPFTGTIKFKGLAVQRGGLPDSAGDALTAGTGHTFTVSFTNPSSQSRNFFADPRLGSEQVLRLISLGGDENAIPLPSQGNDPAYIVPPHSSELDASVHASAPATFTLEYGLGDPQISPLLGAPFVTGAQDPTDASLSLQEPQIAPGVWFLDSDLNGPFGAGAPPAATAQAQASVDTLAFDPTVTTSTTNFWKALNTPNGNSVSLDGPIAPGHKAKISVTITPTGAPGTEQSGTLYITDFQTAPDVVLGDFNEVAAIPYDYTVK